MRFKKEILFFILLNEYCLNQEIFINNKNILGQTSVFYFRFVDHPAFSLTLIAGQGNIGFFHTYVHTRLVIPLGVPYGFNVTVFYLSLQYICPFEYFEKKRVREATYQKYNELLRSSNEIKKVSIGKNKAVPFLSNDNKNRHLTQA